MAWKSSNAFRPGAFIRESNQLSSSVCHNYQCVLYIIWTTLHWRSVLFHTQGAHDHEWLVQCHVTISQSQVWPSTRLLQTLIFSAVLMVYKLNLGSLTDLFIVISSIFFPLWKSLMPGVHCAILDNLWADLSIVRLLCDIREVCAYDKSCFHVSVWESLWFTGFISLSR